MNANSPGPRQQARFETTRWSVVLRAGGDKTNESQRALNELVEAYWYPLYAFSRRRGNSDHDAMDLTQGFLLHLVSGGGLESVSQDKGRFRSFLLASFKNFMANQHRAAETVRRGGAVTILSLTTTDFRARYEREPLDPETPELVYERSWVEELLARVRRRLSLDYQRAEKQQIFDLLEPHLTHSDDALPRAEIGRQLQLSAAAVNMSIHRMRRRFGELLREEVAATVDDPADVEDELRELMAALRP